jgi:hypothetical protein
MTLITRLYLTTTRTIALGKLRPDFHMTDLYKRYAADHMCSDWYKAQVGSRTVCKQDEAAN